MHIHAVPPDLAQVRVKKPLAMGRGKTVFPITFGSREGPEHDLFLQSTPMVVTYNPLRFQDKDDVVFSLSNDKFITSVSRLRDHIVDKVSRRYMELLEGKRHLDAVQDPTCIKLKARPSGGEATRVFDETGGHLTFEEVKEGRRAQVLIWVKWLWVSAQFYGIEYAVLQVQVQMPPALPMFVSLPCKYEKYKKMLKMGIPLPAVQAKMTLDGLPQNEREEFACSVSASAPAPLSACPAPSPVSTPTGQSILRSPMSFLGQIASGNFSLKRVSNTVDPEEEKRKQVMNKISKYVDTTRSVPTLDEIVSARANLRKT